MSITNLKKLIMLMIMICFMSAVSAFDINNSNYDTARTISSPGTYYLTENITNANGIVINSDNVTLDGNGNSLTVSGSHGIQINSKNVFISNIDVNSTATSFYQGISSTGSNITLSGSTISSKNYYGLFLDGSDNNTISGNTITSEANAALEIISGSENNTIFGNTITSPNSYGACIVRSGNNIVSGNTINSSNYGMYVRGTLDGPADNNIISGNTINSYNDGIYVESYADNNTISGNTIKSTSYEGIFLINVDNNLISGNTITSHNDGIYVGEYSINNTISGNTINSSNYGVTISYYADGNTISGNTGNSSRMGIYVGSYSDNNTISGNSICPTGAYHSIYLTSSCQDNYISETKFENLTKTIYVESSCGVYVYLNDFINSSVPEISGTCIFNSPANVSYDYDGTTYSGIAGNYWSDYNETNATITNGIWSIPYAVTLSINDSYPLAEPVTFEIEEEDEEETVDDGKIHLTQDDFDIETGYILNEPGYYVLDENIVNPFGIFINSSNVTIDGMGYSITGDYGDDRSGIHNIYYPAEGPSGEYLQNITIKNTILINWYDGIGICNMFDLTLVNCSFFENDYAIDSWALFDGTISNCTFQSNNLGIYLYYSENMVLTNNSVTDTREGLVLDGENITISTCNFTGYYDEDTYGIEIGYLQNGIITNCTISILGYGICDDSEGGIINSEISYNEFIDNMYALEIYGENNTMTYNEFINNYCGLNLFGKNNWIYLNKFEGNNENMAFESLLRNYFHSPEVTYEYDGETYTGRLGNYYAGEELGTSNAGIFGRPYGIELILAG